MGRAQGGWLPGYLITMILLTTAGLAGADDKLEAEYRDKWASRESMARSDETRRELAEELIAVGKRERRPDRACFYFDKAYTWASRNRRNYDVAANALEHMQRVEPGTRLDALVKLETLYQQAYRGNPKQVAFGLRQAITLEMVAEERAERIALMLDAGKLDPAEGATETSKAIAELASGLRVLPGVARKTEVYVDLAEKQAPKRVPEFQQMIDRANQTSKSMSARQDELREQQKAWLKLRGAARTFETGKSPAAALNLATMLAVEFDRPDAISPEMLAALPEPDRRVLAAAVAPPQRLDAALLEEMGRWYGRQMAQGSKAGRTVAAARSAFYCQRAADKGRADAKALADEAMDSLNQLAGNYEAAAALSELEARLNYRPLSSAVAAITPPATDPTPTPAAETPSTTSAAETPSTTSAADTPSTTTRPATVAASRSIGRPMVDCTTCGRRFFPGWGVTGVHQCPRCQAGHANIFDFGKD